MAQRSNPSSFNSLKGKISLATSAMAVFTCAFGAIIYLTVSLVVKDTFFTVFVPFLLMAFVILVFGWWISNEVIRPILKLNLLAKSLERSPTASLPKTSGSGETDELLETLNRNSQQLQAVVGMMEKVAAGDLNVALTPLENSDRLVTAFQKLLARVTESIYAKENLDKLEKDIDQLTFEIGRTRNGNLDVDIKTDLDQTKELADSVKFLIYRLSETASAVRKGVSSAGSLASDTQKVIQEVIVQDEAKAREMGQASARLRESPHRVQKISEELSGSIAAANQSLEKARKGNQAAEQSSLVIDALRKRVKEAIKKIQILNERSQEIGKVAKNLDDLANRSNLIALNASIQAVAADQAGSGFSILAEEVERLSERAGGAGKQMSALNKLITAEIAEVEDSLHSTVSEVVNISKFAIEAGNSLDELERYIGQFLNLQSKLAANSSQQTIETDQALQVFTSSLSESTRAIGNLRETESSLANLSALIEGLKSAVSDLRLPQADPTENVPRPAFELEEMVEFTEMSEIAELVDRAKMAEPVEQV